MSMAPEGSVSAAKAALAKMEPYRLRVFSRVTNEFSDLASTVEEALREAPCLQTENGGLPEAPALLGSARAHAEPIVAALFQDERLSSRDEGLLTDTGALGASAGLSDRDLIAGAQRAVAACVRWILALARQIAIQDGASGQVVASVHYDFEGRRAQLERQINEALVQGHDRYTASTARGERSAQVFVKRLTRGQFDDEHEIRDGARAVGFDLSRHWGMVVLTGAPDVPREAIETAVGKLVTRSRGAIPSEGLASPAAHTAVLVAARGERAWKRAELVAGEIARCHGLFALCYEPVDPLEGLAVQYARAIGDLSVPIDTDLAPGALTSRQLAFYRVCTSAPVSDRLHMVDLMCGRLLDHPSAENLIETLEALSRVGTSAPQVGKELGLHENAVRKRYRTIHELTGLNVRRPQDLVYLLVAIRLRPVRPRGMGSINRREGKQARTRRAPRGVGPTR